MPERPPSEPSQGKPPDPWRIERMVQRVPAHLGEGSTFSPWLVVGAVAVLALVGGLLLWFSGLPSTSEAPLPGVTRTRTPRPTVVIVVTATPVADTATPTTRPTPYMIEYIVQSGDTLSTIAREFNVSVDTLREVNDLTGDIIRAGDKLLIPQPTPTPGAQSLTSPSPPPTPTEAAFSTPTLIPVVNDNNKPQPATTPTPTPGVVVYYIQSGDTLSTIAKVFSTTVQAIMDLNKLTDTTIRVGQVITVPVGAWTPTRTPTIVIVPTVTETPVFVYGAPALLSPPQGASIAKESPVTFQWTGVGVLGADEYYVLALRFEEGGEERIESYNVGHATSLRLAEPPANPGTGDYTWYVVAVRGSGCGPASPAAVNPCAISPPSMSRTFSWK